MLDSHTDVSIAQAVFWAPMLPVAFYVVIKNWHNRPRMAFTPLIALSILRLTGGIVVILVQFNPDSIPLIIVALICLSVGTITVIISTLGMIRTIVKISLEETSRLHKVILVFRIFFYVAISLLISAGSLGSIASTASVGLALEKAGYLVFACMVLAQTGILIYLSRNMTRLADTGSLIYFYGTVAAMPFIFVRTVYGVLYAFNSSSIKSFWNPLFGNAIAFALMALLPEAIMALIYVYLGFHRMRKRVETEFS